MTWKRNKREDMHAAVAVAVAFAFAHQRCVLQRAAPTGTRWRSRHLAAGEHRHYCVNCVRPQSAVYGVIWSYGGAGIGVDRLFAPAACRVELEASCARLADFQFQPVGSSYFGLSKFCLATNFGSLKIFWNFVLNPNWAKPASIRRSLIS